MAFPFKTGGDFYNCEALNMRLHNHSADLNEYGTGTIYFNTGSNTNHSKHAVVHDGTNFKALAFVDEIATNTAFTALTDRVETIEKALGEDTANVIDTWEEIQNFLKDINANDANLMTMLNSKANAGVTGGSGFITVPYTNNQEAYLIYKGGMKWELSNEGWAGTRTILHSGNYSDYALPKSGGTISGIGKQEGILCINDTGEVGWGYVVFTRKGTRMSAIGADASNGGFWIQNNQEGSNNKLFAVKTDNLYYGKDTLLHSGNIGSYKAGGLAHSNGTVGAVVNSSGNVTIGDSDLAGASYRLHVGGRSFFGHAIYADRYNAQGNMVGASIVINKGADYFGMGPSASNASNISFGLTSDTFGTWKSELLTIAQNGNVLIGTTEDKGQKLSVVSDKYAVMRIHRNLNTASVGAAIACSSDYAELGTMGWNQPNEFKLQDGENNKFFYGGKDELCLNTKKTIITGDLEVEGNIIGKKEVSAGGAGQEGESGDGGAEVIAQELAKGQSSYTIPNTIGRSAVAVSLYEWNANNSSWDMCLADISVKDATITITFGSATSVNHKLVAVG